jgi:polysaccharide export outer membrane protein
MTRGRRLFAIVAIFVLTIGPSVSAAQSGQAAAGADRVTPSGRYQLRSGDVLGVNFPFVPDFNQTITVQPDGFITLRALGSISVASLTVPELSERLRAEYSTILQNPVLTVELKEFEKPFFVVAGEVERPGRYDLHGGTTAAHALAVAGGITSRAKSSEAVIVRRLPEGTVESRPLNLKAMLKEGRLNADVPLQPGDMLFVPRGRGSINWSAVSVVVSSLWVVTYLVR